MDWILVVKASPPPHLMVFEIASHGNVYEFILARTCKEACEITDTLKPALFLLDVELSDTSIFELYDRLHGKPGLEDVPAILLGPAMCPATQCEVDRRDVTYLCKPVQWETLLESIDAQVLATPRTITRSG